MWNFSLVKIWSGFSGEDLSCFFGEDVELGGGYGLGFWFGGTFSAMASTGGFKHTLAVIYMHPPQCPSHS